MAPVLQNNIKERDRGDRSKRPGDRRSELIWSRRFTNNLPEIPFDPKFITYPFDSNRFVQYKPTSLEKNYKHDLLTQHDLGVSIDLINPDTYAVSADAAPMAMEDEKLLEEETAPSHSDSKRSQHHNKVVPWLKKTEYISTEFNRYGASSEKTETKVGYNVKKNQKDDMMSYIDREGQINAINSTFEDVKKEIKEHHSKRGVTPVEILDVFPDFDLWKYPFAQVQFDADPAPLTQIDKMSQAMIRGVMDESGEQFVAYFLPTDENLQKRAQDKEKEVEYVPDEEYDYKMAREYNWNVKNKMSKGYEENYFFAIRKDGVFYNELETRVKLSKRRAKQGSYANNSKLFVKHRALNDTEFKFQDLRMVHLQPPQEEEDEEEIEAGLERETVVKKDEVEENEEQNNESQAIDEPEKQENVKVSESSSSGSGSDSSSGSSSSSDSESQEGENERKMKVKRDKAEIFGSGSDSD